MCRLLATFSNDAIGAVDPNRAAFMRLTVLRRRGVVLLAILRHAAAHTQMGALACGRGDGIIPRQRRNYHLAGLLAVIGKRRKGKCHSRKSF